MKVLCVAAFFLLVSQAFAAESWAHCSFMGTNTDPNIHGTALFHQVDSGPVEVTIQVAGITRSLSKPHGIHVHFWGDLTGSTDGLSVGGHYWTGEDIHSCPDNVTRHNGDMGNWDVDENGNIMQNKTLDLLSLHGTNSIIGRAVVIHNDTDNCNTVSSSGARLAFCVIGIANRAESNAAAAGATVVNATCIMMPTNNSTVGQMPMGQIWFIQSGGNVEVRAQITGITGTHGFHVHQFGTVATDGLGSGSHWNYNSGTHGIPSSGLSRHNGDMGNIYHYIDGTAYYSFTNDMLSLNGNDSIVGRIVHIHQNPDICTPPIGLAGNRIGQCVIGIANPSTAPIALPGGVPTIQAIYSCFNSTTAVAQSQTVAAGSTNVPADSTNVPADNSNVAVNAIPSIVFAVVLLAVALF